jgi:hypothetical protein
MKFSWIWVSFTAKKGLKISWKQRDDCIQSKSTEPYLELAYTLLDQKRALSEQMSLLGTSASEMLAYDKLKLKWMMSLKRPFHT